MTYFANIKKDFCLDNELEKWFCKWHRKVVTGRCVIELKNINKEFIRLLKENIKTDYEDVNECIYEEIDKLTGAELTKPNDDGE